MITLRNSLRPVNRLPPELLTSCAAFVSNADPRPIIPLTHVCRYWRRSITSNPRNWASIATGWKRLVPLCLERAGTVPLALDITIPDIKSDPSFLRELLPHVARVGHFSLTGHSSIKTVADDLPGFFDSSMPNLTSLELQQTTEPAEIFPSGKTPVPPIFRNVTKLESLCLTRTPLYPALLGITSLRELKLLGYTSPFHFGTFLGFLGSNPGLELLVLDIQFVVDSVEIAPARMTSLPRLQRLSITCSKPIDSRGLLSCISFPHGVNLEVVFTKSDQSAQLESFLPSPPTLIRKLLAPITTIKTQVSPQELRLFGNGTVFTFRSSQAPLVVHQELALFPVATVHEFHTNVHPFKYTDIELSKVLKALPSLKTLVFSNTIIPRASLSALAEEPVLCPALKTIIFFKCSIGPNAIQKLGEAIVRRRDLTVTRLHRVVILNDSRAALPEPKSIRQLRKSVPHVDVRVNNKLPAWLSCSPTLGTRDQI